MSFEYEIENDFKELLKGLTDNIYAVSSAGDKRKYPCIAIKLDKTEDADIFRRRFVDPNHLPEQ